MGKEFSLIPREVPRVETKYRRIVTPIPHPDSLPTLEKLRRFEPTSMRGQPPVVWDRAEDICVFDKYGNQWLDWSSGVLVANAGHGAPEIRRAIAPSILWAAITTISAFLVFILFSIRLMMINNPVMLIP